MSDETPNPLEGLLSEFALGPSWARAKSDSPSGKTHDRAEREFQPRRQDDREGNRGGDRRGADRRESRDGGGRRQGGGGGNRRENFNDRGRPEKTFEEATPTEGVNVSLVPEKQAIQLVCKEIQQVARVYPLFDIAQIILADRPRSRAVFEMNEKKPAFLRCKLEDAVFITREEALRHMLQADWRHRFIEESTFEVDPPKGNFQSVAKCGLSGEWLGPPNYHEYQTNLRRIHRERFAHMPFEAYSAKVRIERSEEAVNEWLESMKNQTRWRILSEEESAVAADCIRPAEQTAPEASPADPSPEPIRDTAPESEVGTGAISEPPASEAPTEDTVSEPTEETATEEQSEPESQVEATEAEETPSEAPPEEAPAAEVSAKTEPTWFTDRAEFERALATEVLDRAFQTTRKAKVSAAIPGKNLSPGLLVRLKGTGNHHKKHPAILIPAVCKALETEHMPVFKRKGKLFTGPARPHSLAADAVLAPRPAEMVKWIRESTPAKLGGLWKAVLPEGATAPPAEYAADLFWLLQQGHILLYTDDTLVVQEAAKPQEPKKPKAKKEPQKEAKKKAKSDSPDAPPHSAPPLTEPATPPSEEITAPSEETTPPPDIATAPTEPETTVSTEIPETDQPGEDSQNKPLP